ncbi:hypothetical protein [Galactobacter valiniphilus]|uniref:hypothetical protein n=1 Tax=Galactobacter valiniphilus TaxID=2676122 RepID=UPI003734C6BD
MRYGNIEGSHLELLPGGLLLVEPRLSPGLRRPSVDAPELDAARVGELPGGGPAGRRLGDGAEPSDPVAAASAALTRWMVRTGRASQEPDPHRPRAAALIPWAEVRDVTFKAKRGARAIAAVTADVVATALAEANNNAVEGGDARRPEPGKGALGSVTVRVETTAGAYELLIPRRRADHLDKDGVKELRRWLHSLGASR